MLYGNNGALSIALLLRILLGMMCGFVLYFVSVSCWSCPVVACTSAYCKSTGAMAVVHRADLSFGVGNATSRHRGRAAISGHVRGASEPGQGAGSERWLCPWQFSRPSNGSHSEGTVFSTGERQRGREGGGARAECGLKPCRNAGLWWSSGGAKRVSDVARRHPMEAMTGAITLACISGRQKPQTLSWEDGWRA